MSRTAEPVDVKFTTKSPALLPPVGPAWTGPVMLVTVAPYTVRFRPTPENVCAPETANVSTTVLSLGNVNVVATGKLGHMVDTPPPPLPQRSTVSVALYVARKSYAFMPPAVKS